MASEVEKTVTGQTFVLKTLLGPIRRKSIFGRQTFGNVRAAAIPADIYEVATALVNLQSIL